MIVKRFQRIKRQRSQRHDHSRIYQRNRAPQEFGAVSQLGAGGSAVRPRRRARIAERGAGDEDVGTPEVDRSQEPFEVFARLIAGKWDARAVRALASRRFADEQYTGIDWAIEFA